MTVHFIGAGPGAPDLLTIRGREIISQCKVCLYAGSLVPREILDYCPSDAKIINTAPMDLDGIISEIKKADHQGNDVARLHSGDLSVWSALGEQIRRLKKEGIEISITPGVPSFAAAAAALGVEFTLPGISQSVILTRTPGRASSMPELETLKNFAATGSTIIIHLSIQNLQLVVDELVPFYGLSCPVAVVFRASWPEEKIIRSNLANIQSKMPKEIERTALIIVGSVLSSEKFTESSLYSKDYDRRFRPQSTFDTTA